MMICPHCQSENREGAKFCNECGSPLLSCADKTQVIDAVALGDAQELDGREEANDADKTQVIDAATALRRAGIRTQLYTEPKKFKAKMNYADKLGVPYVLFLGEDEIAAGMVSCKNMTTGAQTKLPVADAIVMIREDLAERNKGKVIVE